MKNLDLWREHAEEMEIKLRHAEEMKPPSDPAERLLHERYLKLKREDLKQLKLQNEYEAIRDCNTPKARKRRAQLENKIGGFDWEQHFAAWDRLTGRLPWIYPPDAPAIPESSPPSPNGSKAISRQRWHGTLPELAEWIHRAQASGHFGNVTPATAITRISQLFEHIPKGKTKAQRVNPRSCLESYRTANPDFHKIPK